MQRSLCHHAGLNYGPYTLEEIQFYMHGGNLPPGAFVQNPQTGQWIPIQQFMAAVQPNPVQENPHACQGQAGMVQPGTVPPHTTASLHASQQPQHAAGQPQDTNPPTKKGLKRTGVALWIVGLLVAIYLMTIFNTGLAWFFASPLFLTSAFILHNQGFWKQKKNMFTWMNE